MCERCGLFSFGTLSSYKVLNFNAQQNYFQKQIKGTVGGKCLLPSLGAQFENNHDGRAKPANGKRPFHVS